MKSPIAAYRQLFVTNTRLVIFSFLMALYSSFGQTYFIGVFGPQIQAEFGLSHTLWGSIYLAGTLISALLMPFTGALIDRFSLSGYALVVGLVLLAACAYISVVTGPIMLVLAIFLLRHSGQGLASHVSITSMARYFDRERGRAIAVASLGYSVGEAILPFLAVLLIALVGWRWTYGSAAILIGVTLIPATIWLLS
ncbi:MAG: MFS transporter, partial [Arenicellales bacterium]|nr:MFS transporter [Arenicellales bacterium]